MYQIGWIICRLAAIAYWIVGLIIKYLWYAVPGVFKVIWNPIHAPTALVLMLISFLDYKLYDKIYLGTYHTLWHGIIILSPFMYFYYLGKHKRNITVNKTITIKHVPVVHDPINQVQRPNKDRIEEPRFKKINQQEPFARHCGFDIRDAKTIDYTIIEDD